MSTDTIAAGRQADNLLAPQPTDPDAPREFAATRRWRYEGYEGGIEDSLILVDGQEIGGAYYCADETWTSYGPAGHSPGHAARELAESAQVRAYATNPDLHDRMLANARATKTAEQTRLKEEAELRRTQFEERARRERLGDDEPGPTEWELPAYHALYAPTEEVTLVSTWLKAHGVGDASVRHPIRVEQRATRRVIVFEQARSLTLATGGDFTQTRVVTVEAEPPDISTSPRPDLHNLLDQHWPSAFPLIDYGGALACGHCTKDAGAITPDQMVAWPCPTIQTAVARGPAAGGADQEGVRNDVSSKG